MGFLVPVFEFCGSILTSRAGLLALAFAAGWAYSAIKCDVKIDAAIASIKAAHRQALEIEVERERASAAEIAKAATERVMEDQQTISDLNDKIANFSKQEAPRDKKNSPCVADSVFVGVVRDLAKPRKHAPSSR